MYYSQEGNYSYDKNKNEFLFSEIYIDEKVKIIGSDVKIFL